MGRFHWLLHYEHVQMLPTISRSCTCRPGHNNKKPVTTREFGRNSNRTKQQHHTHKRCCVNQTYLENCSQSTAEHTNFHRAFRTRPMTANTTTVIYPQLVSIFSYGFLTTAWRHPHASTDALYIEFALKTLKDHLYDGSTRTATIAREHTRSTSTLN